MSAIGPVSLENECTWKWQSDGLEPTTDYVFEWHVKGVAKSSAAICVDSSLFLGRGYGKFEAYSYIKLTLDTANSEEESSELRIWAGAEVPNNGGGGLSGIGIGVDSASIEWEEDEAEDEPNASKQESITVDGVKSDPGPVCFIKCRVEVLAQSGPLNYLYNGGGQYPTKGSASAYLDSEYPSLKLGAPEK